MSFVDFENTVKSLRAELRGGSEDAGGFLNKLSDNRAIAGLSRFDNSVGQLLFKFRGLVDTFASVKGRIGSVINAFNVFSSASAKENKIIQDKLGGYKKLIRDFKNIKKAHKEGTVGAMEYADAIQGLKDAGVLDSKGKPTGGFFGNLKAFIKTGLKLFKNFLIFGSLLVIGFALLFPILKENLPKIKGLFAIVKEKFNQVVDTLRPVFEAIKVFFKVLLDPNATWIEKVGAYVIVLGKLAEALIKLALAALAGLAKLLLASVTKLLVPMIVEFFTNIPTFLGKFYEDFLKPKLGELLEALKGFVDKNKGKIKQVGGGALIGGAVGGIVGSIVPIIGTGAGAVIGGTIGGAIAARADGGPVMAGRPYMVGERGPELFMPNSSGMIIPNGAGNTINVHVNGRVGASDHELRDIARRVGQMVSKEINRTTSFGVRL
mgnify:CR=1 FL=1